MREPALGFGAPANCSVAVLNQSKRRYKSVNMGKVSSRRVVGSGQVFRRVFCSELSDAARRIGQAALVIWVGPVSRVCRR
ncbi:hypothetical protein [Nocardia sp. NPDC051981]|uniref:hypothetical protein n=1 Tax=Nocardia sp. NPDC051981 TaxID=3155417 RepID=UPI00341EACEF